ARRRWKTRSSVLLRRSRLRRSSPSRFLGKAASSLHRKNITPYCKKSAANTGFCSSRTKCNRELAVPESFLLSNTTELRQTLLPPQNRWAEDCHWRRSLGARK